MSTKTRITTVLTTAALALAGSTVALATPAQAAGVWDRVAACESGGNWSINTGNGFYGGLQFTRSTWLGFGGGAYASTANRASKAAQIFIARRVLVGQGPGAWPVCSVRAGLTRASGAASRATARKAIVNRHKGKLVVDGIMGPLTRAAMARHRIYLHTTPAVRAWQHRLRVGVDGLIGPITTSAMQRWLNTH